MYSTETKKKCVFLVFVSFSLRDFVYSSIIIYIIICLKINPDPNNNNATPE